LIPPQFSHGLDCLQLPLHFPPLSRRGGSHPPGSLESIPLRSYPGFVVLDRVPRLWFSHPTQPAARARPAHLWPTPVCAPAAFGCPALVGSSVCRTDTRRYLSPDHAGLRLSCTGTRTIHACRCRKHGPIYDRHTPILIASTPVTAFVSDPDMPNTGVFANIPALEYRTGRCIGPVHRTLRHHIRASDSPKSLRLRRSGSNNRKGTIVSHARGSAAPGLDSGDEKEKERD